jgi:hypothetical protein
VHLTAAKDLVQPDVQAEVEAGVHAGLHDSLPTEARAGATAPRADR